MMENNYHWSALCLRVNCPVDTINAVTSKWANIFSIPKTKIKSKITTTYTINTPFWKCIDNHRLFMFYSMAIECRLTTHRLVHFLNNGSSFTGLKQKPGRVTLLATCIPHDQVPFSLLGAHLASVLIKIVDRATHFMLCQCSEWTCQKLSGRVIKYPRPCDRFAPGTLLSKSRRFRIIS